MTTFRKRSLNEDDLDRPAKKRHTSSKGFNLYIPFNFTAHNAAHNTAHNTAYNTAYNTALDSITEPTFTQAEVTALLAKQEQTHRQLLEEALREQYNIFNKFYTENLLKTYNKTDCSYIS